MWVGKGARAAELQRGLDERRQLVLQHAESIIHGATCLDCMQMGRAALALALADWDLADLVTADMMAQAGLEPLHG